MSCPQPAVLKVSWPGRDPVPMRGNHATTAQRTAVQMGLYITVETGATGFCQCEEGGGVRPLPVTP